MGLRSRVRRARHKYFMKCNSRACSNMRNPKFKRTWVPRRHK